MTVQTFEIPGTLPNLNDYTAANRADRRAGARMKRECQQACAWAIKAARLRPAEGPVDIEFTWIEPNMRRDKDNIRFAAKFVLDALVECGVIVDDGWKYVESLSDKYRVSKKDPRVVVRITERTDK